MDSVGSSAWNSKNLLYNSKGPDLVLCLRDRSICLWAQLSHVTIFLASTDSGEIKKFRNQN